MTRFLLLCLSLVFVGCIGDHGHRVHVRRTPEEVVVANRKTKDYVELREEMKQTEENNALTGDLHRSEGYSKVRRLLITRAMAVPVDPWDSFEEDRFRTLYRKWKDRLRDPPPVVLDTGPPQEAEGEDAEGEGEEGGDEDDEYEDE